MLSGRDSGEQRTRRRGREREREAKEMRAAARHGLKQPEMRPIWGNFAVLCSVHGRAERGAGCRSLLDLQSLLHCTALHCTAQRTASAAPRAQSRSPRPHSLTPHTHSANVAPPSLHPPPLLSLPIRSTTILPTTHRSASYLHKVTSADSTFVISLRPDMVLLAPRF